MRLLTDENFNGDIIRGLLRLVPDLDFVRAQDTELYQAPDEVVLEWAAREQRVVLTHDVNTMTKYAYERVMAGLPMAGVIEVPNEMALGPAIEQLHLVIGTSLPDELNDRVIYLPIRLP